MRYLSTDLFQGKPGLSICLLCAIVVSGCQSNNTGSQFGTVVANDYRLRHPIVITEQPETLDLPVGRGTRNLNRHLSERITAYAAEARRQGNGHIEILVPAGSANEAAAHSILPSIRTAVKRGGVSGHAISTRSYSVSDYSADAPVRLSFAKVMATAGPCGEWPKNIGGGVFGNNDYENFGCAQQANLAAIVSNPADLISPRAAASPDQMRRATVFEKYREGVPTASEFKEGDGATVSESE